jgi:predicted alpha-1,6-mannanase (GH76 family)
MTTATEAIWSARADVGQVSLDHFFGTGEPQLLNNTYPSGRRDNKTFNYWWLAHVIDVRLDAYERSGDRKWLGAAEATYRNVLARNRGSFLNDFFDDMLWCGMAILRLHDATGNSRYLDDAEAIWAHVVEFGWNDEHGYSVAWRKRRPHYKNTAANGPFVIFSCRLAQHRPDPSRIPDPQYSPETQYIQYAQSAYDWLTNNLVDRHSGFVADGINRDGRIDTQLRFTYNQGLYVGAAVELSHLTGNRQFLQQASRTALTAIEELATGGLFRNEGDGDGGLFKGVYYRYVGLLLADLDPGSATALTLARFFRSSTDALWKSSFRNDFLLAGTDWSKAPSGKVAYTNQLSAIMALEQRARLESG